GRGASRGRRPGRGRRGRGRLAKSPPREPPEGRSSVGAMSPPGPAIARVEPLTRTRAVRGPFDYRTEGRDLEVGTLLRVPFGRRAVTGVVVSLADDSELEPDRLAEPEAVLPL